MALDHALSSTERQLVTFYLGNDEFGADIMNVREIVRPTQVTKVPNTPSYIEGICNLRGKVLPIIDGKARFNMAKKPRDENSRVVVIDIKGKSIGIVVDKVSEVMGVGVAEIESPPEIIRSIETEYLSGIVKLKNGERLIMLLELAKVLELDLAELLDGKLSKYANPEQVEKKTGTTKEKKISEEHLVSFRVDKEEYGISIMEVQEIIRVPDIVKVPQSPPYMAGVVSIRNKLLPIINLRLYLGLENQGVTDQTRILVVDMGQITAGIMVDRISEVMRVSQENIQPPPRVVNGQSQQQLKGVAKLNDGQRLILLLEPSQLLSKEEKELDLLAAPTSLKAENKQNDKEVVAEEQLVTFKLDREEYGIKINDVQEINRMTGITKIPNAPNYIQGLVNLRGNIIPALDLRKRFGLDPQEVTDATRIIIVDLKNKKTGIIVDGVSEVLRFEKSLMETPPGFLNSNIDSKFILEVAKLNNGQRIIQILDLGKVLNYS